MTATSVSESVTMSRGLEILGTHEVAERLGVSKNVVAQWLSRGRMPEPDWRLAMGPVWRASTIDRWDEKRRGEAST